MAKRVLDQLGVEYRVIDVEKDEEAARRVMEQNQGNRAVPTFQIDGAWYTNPDPATLERLVKAL